MNSENEPFWKLMQYTTSGGDGVITKWLKKSKNYDDFAKEELETVLDILIVLKNEKLWSMPEYRRMTNLEDIGEIRFKSRNKVQLRIFGIFLKEKLQYAMLIGAIEDNKKYDPQNTLDTALVRRGDVLNDGVELIEFNYKDDEDEY